MNTNEQLTDEQRMAAAAERRAARLAATNYRVAYAASKSGRWQSKYILGYQAAEAFGRTQFKALIYDENDNLALNLTDKPTTGYAGYVQGFRIR